MGAKSTTVDQIAARIAGSAHGIVTREELLAAGVGRRAIAGRLKRGALLAEYRGVYRVGHRAASTEATYLAAVKACGEGAVLSGRAAGYLWRLVKGAAPPPEVSAPQRRPRPRPAHSSLSFTREPRADGLSRHPGNHRPENPDRPGRLPVRGGAGRACHEAGVLYRTTPAQVKSRPNAPGAAKLRRVLVGGVDVTLSALEREFLRILRREGLPIPITNRRAGAKYVDCRWPEHALTVELDSYRFHNSRHSWEQDRRREREAYRRGDAFRRYTWADVFEDPSGMLRELTELLR